MDQFTHELLEKKFKKLRQEHSDISKFPTLAAFVAEFEGQRARPGDGVEHRVSRIDESGYFEPGNVKLIELPADYPARDLELAKYSYPTV